MIRGPGRVAVAVDFDTNDPVRRILGGRIGSFRSISKVKAGPRAAATITTSFADASGRRAWVSVCSVSVFATKTSGVQHQIQDALVVFVDHFNLVHISFPSFYPPAKWLFAMISITTPGILACMNYVGLRILWETGPPACGPATGQHW